MIKLTLAELLAARDVLKKLAQMDFSVRTGYAVARIVRAADAELIPAEQKKNELIRRYGEQDKENGELWRVKSENQAEVDRQYRELLAVEVELTCNPIKMSVLDGERLPTDDRLMAILMDVRASKRAPLDAIPEIRGLTVRLSPLEVMRIEKFLEQD